MRTRTGMFSVGLFLLVNSVALGAALKSDMDKKKYRDRYVEQVIEQRVEQILAQEQAGAQEKPE